MNFSKGDWKVEEGFCITAPRIDGKSGRVNIADIRGFEYFSAIFGERAATEIIKSNALVMANAPTMFEFIRAVFETLEDNGEYGNLISWAGNIIARVEREI